MSVLAVSRWCKCKTLQTLFPDDAKMNKGGVICGLRGMRVASAPFVPVGVDVVFSRPSIFSTLLSLPRRAGHCWYLKYVPPANHAEVFWWCFGYVPCIELVVGSVGFYSVTVSLLNLLRDDDYHGRTISSQIACTLSLLTVPTQTIDPPPTTVDATSLSPPPEPSPTPAHRRSVS
ncbi:hypothetical protein RHGRI_015388 [Rhododendron griersonianum]|uniref:Uncharacterized protein n=1 Tax=Rhododendron griersonianum TaxID=479676 RepID=A0AAV6KDM3_9ERIC|nr:hypothetical protein RHGRI_015388 [Rhododendron griersonianum]